MSVLISGIEMPTEDEEIIIRIDSSGTVMTEYALPISGTKAIPAPPNGRLGDLNALEETIEALIEKHLHGYTKSTWDFVCELRSIISNAPTIVKAEEKKANDVPEVRIGVHARGRVPQMLKPGGAGVKPILFNTEMVCATLDGRKTATRRVIKDPYYIDDEKFCRASGLAIHKGTTVTGGMPYPDNLYSPGDILYVRETWATTPNGQDYLYKADSDFVGAFVRDRSGKLYSPRWRPSIHMPKEAARIFLRVTDVRVERLQEITDKGARAEGCGPIGEPRVQFAVLWETTIKPEMHSEYGWAANPWVWVIEFERCERPKEARL